MEVENKIEKLLSNLKEYVDTNYQLIILNVQNVFINLFSSLASIIIIGLTILFILLFGGIGFAIWLGQYFNNSFIGFFYVSGFFILVTLLLFFNRKKWIKIPLVNILIKKINFDDEN
jgi:hypothetical protein